MTERSLFWDGEVLGDCGPYTQLHLHDYFFRSIMDGTANRGVIRGWRDQLEVTGTSSPISIASGGGVVYGMLYDSDSATSLNISTPASGLSRKDRIVLRRDWSVQTVRVARVAGTAAAFPSVPALTQTALVIWEIPLATVLVEDDGTITITDGRQFCTPTTEWPANCVTLGSYEVGAVTSDKRPDRTRWETRGANEIRLPSSSQHHRRGCGPTMYHSTPNCCCPHSLLDARGLGLLSIQGTCPERTSNAHQRLLWAISRHNQDGIPQIPRTSLMGHHSSSAR